MNKIHGFISFNFILLTIFSVGICQDINQRVNRLETRLDSLISALKGQSQNIIIGDTFFDNSNVQYGIISSKGIILDKTYFVINHNNAWKIPYWVAYYVSSSNLQGTANRTNDFKPDPELPVGSRAELEDYRNSGYDRGHNAPAADFKRSREAMSTTFILSNASPQTQYLNQRIWERLESQVRDMVKEIGKGWIITGNLFLGADSHSISPTTFIGNHVAVPTHCFKIILLYNQANNEYSLYSFMMPNALEQIPGKPTDYIITADRLEQLTGYDFFPKLPDDLENRLESTVSGGWPR